MLSCWSVLNVPILILTAWIQNYVIYFDYECVCVFFFFKSLKLQNHIDWKTVALKCPWVLHVKNTFIFEDSTHTIHTAAHFCDTKPGSKYKSGSIQMLYNEILELFKHYFFQGLYKACLFSFIQKKPPQLLIIFFLPHGWCTFGVSEFFSVFICHLFQLCWVIFVFPKHCFIFTIRLVFSRWASRAVSVKMSERLAAGKGWACHILSERSAFMF